LGIPIEWRPVAAAVRVPSRPWKCRVAGAWRHPPSSIPATGGTAGWQLHSLNLAFWLAGSSWLRRSPTPCAHRLPHSLQALRHEFLNQHSETCAIDSPTQLRVDATSKALRKSRPNLILMCPASHAARISEFARGLRSCQVLSAPLESGIRGPVKRKQDRLLMLKSDDPHAIIQHAFTDVTAARVVHKAYIVNPNAPPMDSLERAAHQLLSDLQQQPASPTFQEPLLVRVSCFPPRLAPILIDLLEQFSECANGQKITMSPTKHTMVAVAVAVSGSWYTGVSPASMHTGQLSFGQGVSKPISRAYFKLKEALLRSGRCLPPGAMVMDVGAAPGSWTQLLLEHGCSHVFAVDPAELSPKVWDVVAATSTARAATEERVTHLKMLVDQAAHVLAEGQQLGKIPPLDACVSDMKLPSGLSAVRVLRESAVIPLLRPGALMVVTIKGGESPGHSKGTFDAKIEPIVAEFRLFCEDVQVLHLFSDRCRERTLVGVTRQVAIASSEQCPHLPTE